MEGCHIGTEDTARHVKDTYWTQGNVEINPNQHVIIHEILSYYYPHIQAKYIKPKQETQ
jgi:hypothetical protein